MKSRLKDLPGNFFIPRYGELSLFLMGTAFVLLFLTQVELRSEISKWFFTGYDPRGYIILLLFAVGIWYSIFYLVTDRDKSELGKLAMLFFAVMANGFGGIAAGVHMLDNSSGFLMLFPIWNIANGVLLLILFRLNVINEDSIDDGKANPLLAIVGLGVVVVTFYVCSFIYEMYWAITFSLCLAYASNVNNALENIIGLGSKHRKEIRL